MDTIPYSELRAHLAETLARLDAREEPVVISRRGEPAAVLMSVAQYERLQGGPKDVASALLAWREFHAAEMAAKGDETWPDPFADVRDRRPDGGRPPFDWREVLGDDAAAPPAGGPAEPKPKPKPKSKAKAKATPKPASTPTPSRPHRGARR